MTLYIFDNHFPLPTPPDALFKAVGMNHGNSSKDKYGLDISYKKFIGVDAVQNVGCNDGYAGVLTKGLMSCCGVALVELNKTNGLITRISMVHLAGGLDMVQLEDLSQSMQSEFVSTENKDYERQLVVFPGQEYQDYDEWINLHFKETLKKIMGSILQVNQQNIFTTLTKAGDQGNESACVTFDGLAGQINHYYKLGHVYIKQDILPTDQFKKLILEAKARHENDEFWDDFYLDKQPSCFSKTNYQTMFRNMSATTDMRYASMFLQAEKLIEKEACDDMSKLKLYYLTHKQISSIKIGDSSFQSIFKNELDQLPLFSTTKKFLMALCCSTIIGMIPATFFYTEAKRSRHELFQLIDNSTRLM